MQKSSCKYTPQQCTCPEPAPFNLLLNAHFPHGQAYVPNKMSLSVVCKGMCPTRDLTWEALQNRTLLFFGWLMEVMQDTRCHQTDCTRTYEARCYQ